MPEWMIALLRSTAVFLLILAGARLLGKRQLSQLTLFDLIVVVAIGVVAGALSLNLAGDLASALMAIVVWIGFPIALFYLSIKFKTVRDLVQGKETILINHGKVLDARLMEARMSPEDLLSQLRRKNVFNFADVEFALLEPSGDLSVLLKKEKQPVTAATLERKVGHESAPQTVILDGNFLDEPLAAMGLNRRWLHEELEKIGVAPENVFLAQVDSVGQLYVDLFDDAINLPQPKTKELLFVNLKKAQADCELYALATKDSQAKQMYTEAAGVMAETVRDLQPLLKR
ncbi:DUF421 domain-containing protein [Heliobacterium gestii]|uniref:DUF421 domain-containing protein n=1 Tax=Heliomicrobium gestii TaxID=2699 RepID=A0A845L995_HELGE|nr:DUF421 domain-containing protein [Heliomicrobium gestii]MBM7866507.1 uncharacterized membrane protein YcaP (DUF421 family) [Heliomicrobium gestii]MZP43212.1 DUF421 domain-containing protein [Heliomicrobium gestii]